MTQSGIAWSMAVAYARLYAFVKARWNINLRGLGWMLNRVREDHIITLGSTRLHFDHELAGCYDLLVTGRSNEPETQAFLQYVLDASAEPVTFVDVGANVGAFLILMAGHPRVARAVGFEPQEKCAAACRRSAALNGFTHVSVVNKVVGDGSKQPFHKHPHYPGGSGIGPHGEVLQTVRLDDELQGIKPPLILLVDVEGAEPLVLEGARNLLAETRPLVVFEYNSVSRRHYQLDRIKSIVGDSYSIFRLRRDGRLDSETEESWNCVAIPHGTDFEKICASVMA